MYTTNSSEAIVKFKEDLPFQQVRRSSILFGLDHRYPFQPQFNHLLAN